MVRPDAESCPACGFPIRKAAASCPNCRWSRSVEEERSREFWWALVIFAGIFFATAIAVYIVASQLHIG